MHKLHHTHACLTKGLSQQCPAVPFHIHRNSRHNTVHLQALPSLGLQHEAPHMVQDMFNHLHRVAPDSVDDLLFTAQKCLGRTHRAALYAQTCAGQLVVSLATHFHLAALKTHDRWNRLLVVQEVDDISTDDD